MGVKLLAPLNDANKDPIATPVLDKQASAPSSPVEGQLYNDTVTKKAYYYNGTAWTDMTGGGGGGSTTYPDEMYPTTGKFYQAPRGRIGPNLALTLNVTYAIPCPFGKTCTLDTLGVEVAVAATTGGVVRLGMWDWISSTDPRPGSLITDFGTTASTGTGFVSKASLAQAISTAHKAYWFSVTAQVAVCTLRVLDDGSPWVYDNSAVTGTGSAGALYMTGTSGA